MHCRAPLRRFQYDFIRRANEIPSVGTYNSPSGIGKQALSLKRTGSTAKFGMGTRDQLKKVRIAAKLLQPHVSATPCMLLIWRTGVVGLVCSCARPVVFPANLCFNYFELFPGLDAQLILRLAVRPSEVACCVAVSQRPAGARLTSGLSPTPSYPTDRLTPPLPQTYISKEHEKAVFGHGSPGPTTGNAVTSLGKQTMSVKNSNAAWGFGSSSRSQNYNNNMPGPGTYYA